MTRDLSDTSPHNHIVRNGKCVMEFAVMLWTWMALIKKVWRMKISSLTEEALQSVQGAMKQFIFPLPFRKCAVQQEKCLKVCAKEKKNLHQKWFENKYQGEAAHSYGCNLEKVCFIIADVNKTALSCIQCLFPTTGGIFCWWTNVRGEFLLPFSYHRPLPPPPTPEHTVIVVLIQVSRYLAHTHSCFPSVNKAEPRGKIQQQKTTTTQTKHWRDAKIASGWLS